MIATLKSSSKFLPAAANLSADLEMQTRYKIVAGSVCGFPKFVTSGSGLGFGFSKTQFWVWVRVQGSKFFQKTGFWVQVWVGFCKKNIKIPAKLP
jgi:hypothetical protein